MKKIARFAIRVLLVVLAMVVMAPAGLIFAGSSALLPNFLGLAYILSLLAIYKTSGKDSWPRKIVDIYRTAFREFFPDL